LEIQVGDGHCSREMPIRSGNGPPEIVALTRASVVFRFSQRLAEQLCLEKEVEITFDISDDHFAILKAVMDDLESTRKLSSDLP
jgi:hypothetical protein